MLVELANLEGTKGTFDHVYGPGELALNDERVRLAGPATVSGRIKRDGSKLKISGSIQAVVEVECDRCLKAIELPVETRIALEYVTTEEYDRLHAAELAEEDLSLSVYNGETIDIDEIVREQVLLAVPTHILCREDCKGLCPTCGQDRNLADCSCEETEIDPRWAELKKLI
jgi:uncharacterized protein